MLNELLIENFAIIDRLLVKFPAGLTVLTGETGAGKSIIIDALQVALGARAGSDVVRGGSAAAVVEAVFEPQENTRQFVTAILEENGIDLEEALILRREINATGRGTARVNGRAVSLSVLAAIGDLLVDIHGQSEHLSILKPDRQLNALDRYAGLEEQREITRASIREYLGLCHRRDEMAAGQREAVQRLDLLRFQVEEIESAGLQSGEEAELETERVRLANALRLTELAQEARDRLQAEGKALEQVDAAKRAVQELAAIDSGLQKLSERLETLAYDLEDVGSELRAYVETTELDPARLEAIEERLDLLARLKRKYGRTIDEVIAFGTEARQNLEAVETFDERLASLTQEVNETELRAARAASELSAGRKEAAERMSQAVAAALQDLGMTATSFEIDLSRRLSPEGLLVDGERYAYGPQGIDQAAFLVSFNPGEPLRSMEKVASGGETSRFLLALKSVLSAADETPTLVFDEIDVGVGARHGMGVGEKLRDLSRHHQVLSISHLPQIAALANHHLRVGKDVADGRTTVAIRNLTSAERVAEIAAMMSGTETETARRTAEELLQAANAKS